MTAGVRTHLVTCLPIKDGVSLNIGAAQLLGGFLAMAAPLAQMYSSNEVCTSMGVPAKKHGHALPA